MGPHYPRHHATHTNFMNPCHTRQNFDPHHPRLLFDPCQIFMDTRYTRQNFTDPCYPRHPHQSLTHATHEPTSPTHPSYPRHPRYLADSYCNGTADLQYRGKKRFYMQWLMCLQFWKETRNELKPVWGFILAENLNSMFCQLFICVLMNWGEMKLKTV